MFCDWKTGTDHSSLRWFLAANKGAFSEAHVDAAGFATFVNILCGEKIWYLKCGDSIPDKDGWDNCLADTAWIPVVLRPSDQLYVSTLIYCVLFSYLSTGLCVPGLSMAY